MSATLTTTQLYSGPNGRVCCASHKGHEPYEWHKMSAREIAAWLILSAEIAREFSEDPSGNGCESCAS